MFRIERDVTAEDGQTYKVSVVFDTAGVKISYADITGSDELRAISRKTIELPHAVNDTLYDLLTLAHPAYKSGVSTE